MRGAVVALYIQTRVQWVNRDYSESQGISEELEGQV